MQAEEIYKPELKKVEVDGFTVNCARPGEDVQICQKGFLTSFDHSEIKMMVEGVRLFSLDTGHLNSLLVVIRDNEARIYKKFPMTLLIRSKVDIKQFHAVFKNQILDIEGVEFKDSIFQLDVKDGDKFLWLFRNGFSFGMYFDFSKKLKTDHLARELGTCYRSLEYYSEINFWAQTENSKKLLAIGWFPFVQLIGNGLEQLQAADDGDLERMRETLVASFTKEKVEGFSKYWWSNSIFQKKKDIICAGLNSFYRGGPDDMINCIKNLLSEIEGIVRIGYFQEHSKDPTTKELKEYLVSKATTTFSGDGSFGFPGLFSSYLNDVVFKGFNLREDIDLSRHSVGHGVAPVEVYTKERALQCILTLDQMYFYLGKI